MDRNSSEKKERTENSQADTHREGSEKPLWWLEREAPVDPLDVSNPEEAQ